MEQTNNQQQNSTYSIVGDENLLREKNRILDLLKGEPVNSTLNKLDNAHSLKKPLPVSLTYENGCYVLIQESLNLGSDSTTLAEAESDLANQLVELYERLSTLPGNQLGPYPRGLLKYLKEFVQ